MDELNFETFLHSRLRERGMNLKRLSEVSGIALKYLEHLSRGEFSQLPPAPYVRGYVLRLGALLDFDGSAWWERLQQEGNMKRSGEKDVLPKNRFALHSPRTLVIGALILFAVVAYGGFRLSKLLGVPELVVISPPSETYTAQSDTLSLEGRAGNADTLTINDEEVEIAPDGLWQKTVMLQPGLNMFTVKAGKTLGREATQVRQVLYEQPATSTPPAAPL